MLSVPRYPHSASVPMYVSVDDAVGLTDHVIRTLMDGKLQFRHFVTRHIHMSKIKLKMGHRFHEN